MNQQGTFHIVVEITKTDRRDLTFDEDRVHVRVIKEKAGVPLDSELFAVREDKYHLVDNDDSVHIKNNEHFVVIPKEAILYSVNGEPQWTMEKELTPVKIMEAAGVDPSQNYLVEIKEHKPESFKDDPNKIIHMHNGLKFITNFMGPKPVS
jgi:hypothetical protein